ncbi:hypothetical protein DERP_006414 [Dermatophagoides pteronyssinus]|uniref:Uncharacterized protein n=1 Tax=Dermatophagoides pteronyssinus TaxID=6956 RepID=A0ABQ8IQA8_DERPT|nr:hypothetical protein DERP_006414 [Dermatophagoides pteronyssinus]
MNKENGHLNIDNNIISSTLTSTSFPNVNHLIDSSNSNCYSSGDSDNNNLEHQHFNNKKIISDTNVGLNSTFTLMDNNVQQQQTYELNNIIMKNDDDVVEKLRKQPDIEIESTTTTAMNSVQKTNDKQKHSQKQQLNTNELSNRPLTTMKKRSMFLTIDHKLAIRRRNIGAIRSYEECEIMSSNVPSTISTLKSSTDDISKSMTILSSNDINNNNNDKKCLTSEFVKNRISSLQQNMSVINNDNDNINIMDLDNQNQQPLIHESEIFQSKSLNV